MIIYASHTPKQGFLLLLIYKKEILFNMEIQTNSSSKLEEVALAWRVTEECVNLNYQNLILNSELVFKCLVTDVGTVEKVLALNLLNLCCGLLLCLA